MALVKLQGSVVTLSETLKKFYWIGYRHLTCPAFITKQKFETKRRVLLNIHKNEIFRNVTTFKKYDKIWSYLARELQVPATTIAEKTRFPLKKARKLQNVRSTLLFLKSSGFQKSVIAESVDICFYPVKNIVKGFQQIAENEEKLCKAGLVGGFTEKNKCKFTNGTLSPDKRLQLCLYYMELPYGFTGHGVLIVDSDRQSK